MKFSVIILLFNSELQKILLTLESVLQQEFNDFEIIISDDGSIANYFNEIKSYFHQKNFEEYRLITRIENIGTVKNFIGALHNARGKYIKGLSPGDLLFDRQTLLNMFDFLETSNYKLAFGRMAYYQFGSNNELLKFNYCAPKDIKSHIEGSQTRLIFNTLIIRDYISGASMFVEKEYALKYYEQLIPTVKYCEDIIQIIVVLNNDKIHFLNEYILWYEYGFGISTDGSSSNSNLLEKDHDDFCKYLEENYSNNKYVKKSLRLRKFSKITNPYLRRIIRVLYEPRLLTNKIRICMQTLDTELMLNNRGFLNDKSFLNNYVNKE